MFLHTIAAVFSLKFVNKNYGSLAIKSVIVSGQKYGSFSAKVWHFWQQSVVVFEYNRSIVFRKSIDRTK